jgi:hypothetical protein
VFNTAGQCAEHRIQDGRAEIQKNNQYARLFGCEWLFGNVDEVGLCAYRDIPLQFVTA